MTTHTQTLEERAEQIEGDIIWKVITYKKEIAYIDRFYISLRHSPTPKGIWNYCFDIYNPHLKIYHDVDQAKFISIKSTLRKINDDYWKEKDK